MEQPFGGGLGGIVQVAFVVDDIARAMDHWSRTFGVGPFFHLPHFPLIDAKHRGKPISPDLDVALTFSGSMCLELIHQNDDGPSPFQGVLPEQGFAVHHVALPTRRFHADLEQHVSDGKVLVASAKVAVGGHTAFLDAGTGPLIELLELTSETEAFFAMIRAAAQSWDGTDPVRTLSTRA